MGFMKEQLKEIELFIKDRKQHISNYKKLEVLEKNPDFISIILEGYCKEELQRLIEIKNSFLITATPQTLATADKQEYLINKQIDAISFFKHYLKNLKRLAEQSQHDLDELEKEELTLNEVKSN